MKSSTGTIYKSNCANLREQLTRINPYRAVSICNGDGTSEIFPKRNHGQIKPTKLEKMIIIGD